MKFVLENMKHLKQLIMNTLNVSTLQALRNFSHTCIIQFPKTCPEEFFRFLSEFIVNLLQGNLQEIKQKHVL